MRCGHPWNIFWCCAAILEKELCCVAMQQRQHQRNNTMRWTSSDIRSVIPLSSAPGVSDVTDTRRQYNFMTFDGKIDIMYRNSLHST